MNTCNRNTAGSKAPTDISELCMRMGFTGLLMPSLSMMNNRNLLRTEELIKLPNFWNHVYNQVTENDILIYQHPTMGKPIAKRYLTKIIEKKKCKVLMFIHDLELLRGGIAGVVEVNTEKVGEFETFLLKNASVIVAHNKKMKAYLETFGISKEIIIDLEIFDYLNGSKRSKIEFDDVSSIAIAGNLSPQKSGYIYDICKKSNTGLTVNLYGKNFKEMNQTNLHYHGVMDPNELGKKIEGKFGLVWDGSTADTCDGNTGNYLRYNNPHKASLYLSAGIPIITWNQAAIADFVLKNKVGIVVSNLHELQDRIEQIDKKMYIDMASNAIKISRKISSGYFFMEAIQKALQIIQ